MPYRVLAALGGSLLLAAPHPGAAQTTEPAPQPRYYVGLAAYDSDYQSTHKGFNIPVQATFGYQFRPRWAVQAGLVYQGYSNDYSYTDRAYLGNGQYGLLSTINESDHYRTFAASALARYTLTRKAAHRLQVDLLGGLTVEHFRSYWRNTRTDSTAAPAPANEFSYRSSRLLATGGLGLRYRFGQRLEATYNLLLSYGIAGSGYSSASMALGLQYRFGRR